MTDSEGFMLQLLFRRDDPEWDEDSPTLYKTKETSPVELVSLCGR